MTWAEEEAHSGDIRTLKKTTLLLRAAFLRIWVWLFLNQKHAGQFLSTGHTSHLGCRGFFCFSQSNFSAYISVCGLQSLIQQRCFLFIPQGTGVCIPSPSSLPSPPIPPGTLQSLTQSPDSVSLIRPLGSLPSIALLQRTLPRLERVRLDVLFIYCKFIC